MFTQVRNQKCSGCKKNPVHRDTLTQISKEWVKEVPYGSPLSDYPWQLNDNGAENQIILTPDYPLSDGCPKLVWEAKSITNDNPDGGYVSKRYDIDNTMPYQHFVYMKKYKTPNGNSYMGAYGLNSSNANTGLIRHHSGSNTTNPYFWHGDLPTTDEWYLIHGIIHPVGTSNSTIRKGGVYKMGSMTEVADAKADFVFRPDTSKIQVREYLYYTSVDEVRQRMYLPSLEVMDGREMPLRLLLGLGY